VTGAGSTGATGPTGGAGGGGASVTISDTAPSSPSAGNLWWDSVGGEMYIWYTDPNSSQWVPVTNLPGSPSNALIYLTTLTPTAAANVDYLLAAGDPYDSYEFEFINVCSNGVGGLCATLQVGGTFQSSGYFSIVQGSGVQGGGNLTDTRTAAIALSGTGSTGFRISSTTNGYSGLARLHAPRTASRVSMTFVAVYESSGGAVNVQGGGFYNAAGPVTGVRFSFPSESANFLPQGSIRVYGRRTS